MIYTMQTESMKDYTFRSVHAEHFSLHDCCPSSVELKGEKLFFYFPDGIAYDSYGNNWPNTGSAAVAFSINNDSTFVRFIDEKDGHQSEKTYTIAQLIEKVNSKAWELEFAYKNSEGTMFSCWIWAQDEGTDYGELHIGNVEYFWNPPCMENH